MDPRPFTIVGPNHLIDPTQPERVLCHPRSTLNFADYRPAPGNVDNFVITLQHISLLDGASRRIAVENTPDGSHQWRFVPPATRIAGVADEGLWPRVISFSGQMITLSQDQFDWFKLDPSYECVVHPEPAVTTILPRGSQNAIFAATAVETLPVPRGRVEVFDPTFNEFVANSNEQANVHPQATVGDGFQPPPETPPRGVPPATMGRSTKRPYATTVETDSEAEDSTSTPRTTTNAQHAFHKPRRSPAIPFNPSAKRRMTASPPANGPARGRSVISISSDSEDDSAMPFTHTATPGVMFRPPMVSLASKSRPTRDRLSKAPTPRRPQATTSHKRTRLENNPSPWTGILDQHVKSSTAQLNRAEPLRDWPPALVQTTPRTTKRAFSGAESGVNAVRQSPILLSDDEDGRRPTQHGPATAGMSKHKTPLSPVGMTSANGKRFVLVPSLAPDFHGEHRTKRPRTRQENTFKRKGEAYFFFDSSDTSLSKSWAAAASPEVSEVEIPTGAANKRPRMMPDKAPSVSKVARDRERADKKAARDRAKKEAKNTAMRSFPSLDTHWADGVVAGQQDDSYYADGSWPSDDIGEHAMREVPAAYLHSVPGPSRASNHAAQALEHDIFDDNEVEEIDPEDAARQAAIQESRDKLAALEADKPLWEDAARKRAREEEYRARQVAEKKLRHERQRAEAERREQEKQRREKVRKEQERKQKLFQEMQAKLKREAEDRAREQERVRVKPLRHLWRPLWTPSMALERYNKLCAVFDTTKYSPTQRLALKSIPWPVLTSGMIDPEDIDWSAVEAFFNAMRSLMPAAAFMTFVDKSHKRFHPDRFRSRGLMRSLEGSDAERELVEKKVNLVAQALTPLWASLRS